MADWKGIGLEVGLCTEQIVGRGVMENFSGELLVFSGS